MKLQAAIAVAAFGSGCIFSFDNPVQAQGAGSVAGHLQLGTSAAGQSLAGARVDLLWSDLSVTVGPQGDFAFLSLPDGTYTLRYTVPAAASNDVPAIGELRDIYLPPLPGGGSDALTVGTLTVNTAGTVEGQVLGTDGGAVVAAFTPDLPDGGLGAYEGFSTSTDDGGHYVLLLPAGDHELWASSPTQSTSVTVTVDAGEYLSQDFELSGTSSALAETELVGYAVLGDFGASAPVSEVQAVAQTLQVGLAPAACPTCGLSLAFQTPDPPAGVSAVQLIQLLQPGLLYSIEVAPPDAGQAGQPLFLTGIPAIAGRTTFLQQVFLFSVKTLTANAGSAIDGGPIMGFGDAGTPVPDAGADGGGLDAGADGGSDAGLDAGFDARVDAGSDAGSDAGMDAGYVCLGGIDPKICGMLCVDLASDPNNCGTCGNVCPAAEGCFSGACQGDGGPGTQSWTLLSTIPFNVTADTIQSVLLLPYPGSTSSGHLLVFIDFDGVVWTTDDVVGGAQGGFAPAVVLNDAGANDVVLGTVAGIGTPANPVVDTVAWWNQSLTEIELVTNSGSGWSTPAPYASSLFTVGGGYISNQTFGFAADPTGNPWIAMPLSTGLQIYGTATATTPLQQAFDGGVPIALAATTCTEGVCLAWVDQAYNVWLGTLTASSGIVTAIQQPFPPFVSFQGAVGVSVPSIVSQATGGIAAVWQALLPTNAETFGSDYYAQGTLDSSWSTSPEGTPAPPLVLPWRAGVIAIAGPTANGLQQLQSEPFGSDDLPPTAFPAGTQTTSQPSGFAEPDGSLIVALNTGTAITIYTLPP